MNKEERKNTRYVEVSPTTPRLVLQRLKAPFSELVFFADSEHTLLERRTGFFIVDVLQDS